MRGSKGPTNFASGLASMHLHEQLALGKAAQSFASQAPRWTSTIWGPCSSSVGGLMSVLNLNKVALYSLS